MSQPFLAEWQGHCPICRKDTTFRAENPWFRDHLFCTSCEGGSIPRERAIMHVLESEYPLGDKRAFMNPHLCSGVRPFFCCENALAMSPLTYFRV